MEDYEQMKRNNAVRFFVEKVLQADATLEQTARHEAGHRLMWKMTDMKPTVYAICNGLPCVMPADGSITNMVVKDMTNREAGAWLAIKLGGIVSEIVALGIDKHIFAIADFIAQDYMSEKPMMDWDDDAEHGGDIPQACTIIGEKAGYSVDALDANLRETMQKIAAAFRENAEEYEKEVAEATAFLSMEAHKGEWVL